ncbi:MAG: hypothetical protein J1E96_04165 [Ruminococcus sp.]|nr:hypothetical protein [Ruminococcus sp.]
MKPFQKVIAAALAILVVISAASCTPISLSKNWSYKYDDSKISEQYDIGVYIYSLYQAYNSAKTYAEEAEGYKENEPFMDLEITDEDGNKAIAKDWIKTEADKIMMNLIALDYLVAEKEATLDEAAMESAKETAQDSWDMGPYASYGYVSPMKNELEPYGISEESFALSSYVANIKQNALFGRLYDKGGLEEVSDEELKNYCVENYLSYSSIAVNLYESSTDDDGNSKSEKFGDKKIKNIKSDLEAIAKKLSDGSMTFEKASEKAKKDYKIDDNSVTTDSVNFKEDFENDNADIYKALKKLNNNEATVITVGEDGDSPIAYIVFKNNIKNAAKDYVTENHASVLSNMKNNDITDLLKKTADELRESDALQVNEGAIGRYDSGMFFVKSDTTQAATTADDDDDADDSDDSDDE